MRRGKATHQKSVQLEFKELLPREWSESPSAPQSGEAGRARHEDERSGTTRLLMEQVVARVRMRWRRGWRWNGTRARRGHRFVRYADDCALGAMQTALPGSYFDRLGIPRLAV